MDAGVSGPGLLVRFLSLFLDRCGLRRAAARGDVGARQDDGFRALAGPVGIMHDAVFIDPAIGLLGPGDSRGKQAEKHEDRAHFHPVSIATNSAFRAATGRPKCRPVHSFDTSEAVVHVELDRVRRHAQTGPLFHFQIDVSIDQNASFRGDTGDFLEMAGNLIDNACKWCESRVKITVTPSTGARAIASGMILTVDDDGPGIPEADLRHVFEPFFYSRTGERGTGIGLAVTYALVQEIGGQISVQSKLGTGTRFNIRLPLKMPRKDQ